MHSHKAAAGGVAGPRPGQDARPSVPPSVLVALAVAAAAVILGALVGHFQMDDWFLLGRASQPLSWEALRFRLATAEHDIVLWVHPQALEIEYFRPVVMLTFWLERRLWGLDPLGYHAVNVLLHAACAGLVYVLFRRLGLRPGIGAWAALGWGLGLAGTTPLAWIAARTESLCALFTFAGALAFLNWRDGAGRRWLAWALLLAALAVTSKETGAAAPLLWMLLAWRTRPEDPAPRARRIGPGVVALLLLPATAALVARSLILQLPLPPPTYLERLASPADAIRVLFQVPLQLLCWLLSVPVSHLGPLEWMLARPPATGPALLVLVVLLFVLARAAGGRALRFALAWAGISLLPAIPVVPTSLYSYQPLAGLAWLLGAAWQRSGQRRWAVWLGVWVAAGTVATGLTLAYQRHASRAMERAFAHLVDEARRRHAERVLLFDAPSWSYGIPPALTVRHPGLGIETWFVAFAPDLARSQPSRIEWTGPDELVVRSARGFFDSPIERFLAFGGRPDRVVTAPGAEVSIRALEPGPHPHALSVRFRDRAAVESSLLFRFRGGDLEAIPTALSVRAHDERLPRPPPNVPARTR